MKIAVCVKQVPEAPRKRIDPGTKRLDRSGEGALNPFDANAVEEALRAGGARRRRRGRASSRWARRARRGRDPQGARDGRRPRRARRRRRGGGLGSRRDEPRRSPQALEREEPDLVLFGQQSGDSDGAVLWAAVAERLRRPVDLAGRRADGRGRQGHGQAPDRVRLRRDRGAAARRRRRLGRDQRAALSVAQGDHGREEEAAGARSRSRSSASTPTRPASRARATTVLALDQPPAARRVAPRRGRRRAPRQIVDFLAEKRLV